MQEGPGLAGQVRAHMPSLFQVALCSQSLFLICSMFSTLSVFGHMKSLVLPGRTQRSSP